MKVGDKVICKSGFTSNDDSGGRGYKEGRVFTVRKLTSDNRILWENLDGGCVCDSDIRQHWKCCGVYGRAVTLVSPITPIKRITKHKMA